MVRVNQESTSSTKTLCQKLRGLRLSSRKFLESIRSRLSRLTRSSRSMLLTPSWKPSVSQLKKKPIGLKRKSKSLHSSRPRRMLPDSSLLKLRRRKMPTSKKPKLRPIDSGICNNSNLKLRKHLRRKRLPRPSPKSHSKSLREPLSKSQRGQWRQSL